MTDKDQKTAQEAIKADKPRQTVREALDALEKATPEERDDLLAEMGLSYQTIESFTIKLREIAQQGKTAQDISQDLLKEVMKAASNIIRFQPFIDAILEAYPDNEAWFLHKNISVTLSPIGAFMQDRGLQDGADITAHKADFLVFFRSYINEMETAYKEDPGLDIKTMQDMIFKKMAAGGLLKNDPNNQMIRTIYPLKFIAPIDKVSKKAFAGELTDQLQSLAMERRESKRQVTTLASINFDAPQLQGLKGLTMYDRSIYNAICSLYVKGKNEYITPQMIYKVITGKEESYLNPKQAKAINSSITKFMYGGIRIDATEEVRRHNIGGSLIYDTNLLHAERVTRNLNGTITECIRIIKTPVLYEYASSKDQIGSVPIASLATPINKTEDTLSLQAYLLERVFGMRGTDPQRDIAYSTIYSAVWGKEAASTKGPQSGYSRIKKSRIRDNTMKMLEHWTTEKGGTLIKGFKEYKRGNTIAGVTISL